MRKYFGAGLIVLGVVLTAYGLDASDSVNVRLTRLFAGGPPEGATWLLIGGIFTVFIGMAMAAHRRPRAS
ncbi:MAG: DUF3185 family protein [Planctomycetota bacterium]|nr:MAG: DUF3185 family protein [Planctomycetota bacterium]